MLNLLHNVFLCSLNTNRTQQLGKVQVAFGKALAFGYQGFVLHHYFGYRVNLIFNNSLVVINRNNLYFSIVAGFYYFHRSGGFTHNRQVLWGACFNNFLNSGESLRNILAARYTAGVESSHCKLSSGLANCLGGGNAYSNTKFNVLFGHNINTVAFYTHTAPCIAFIGSSYLYLFHTGLLNFLQEVWCKQDTSFCQYFSPVPYILSQVPAYKSVYKAGQHCFVAHFYGSPPCGPTVLFPN